MTALQTVKKSLELLEKLRKTTLTEHEQNKFIVEHIYKTLKAQNTAVYNLAMFNAKNEVLIKVIYRSIFLDECLTELENL
jgi:16S rRNA G527 N7-methylase RsmG